MIISKFKDDYDSVFYQYFDSEDVKFVREQQEIDLSVSDIGKFDYYPNLAITWRKGKKELLSVYHELDYIYFNNKIYTFIKLLSTTKGSEKLEKLVGDNYSYHKIYYLDYVLNNPIEINGEEYNFKCYWQKDIKLLEENLNLISNSFTKYINKNKLNFNYFSIYYNYHQNKYFLQIHPHLGKLGFFEWIDMIQFCQDLQHVLTNNEHREQLVEIKDKYKINQHGFDLKQSFRHR